MNSLESKIYGCWMGKSIGGTLGLPVEGQLGPLSLTFYDPVPTIAPPNDDLELQLVWLDLVEKCQGKLTAEDFAQGWLRHIHYMWDEYGRCRWNLRRGVPASQTGLFENWFASGMGSPIRSEIWACLFPDDAQSAGYYAGLDASLDHGIEGIAGEVFFAVMQSRVAAGTPIMRAIEEALPAIPAASETAQVIAIVIEDYRRKVDPWESRLRILQNHNHENFTHGPINVGLAVWALLHGGGDFEKSILLSTNAGYDTDSSTATVGATIGLAIGLENLPTRWSAPIGDGVYLGPGILNLSNAPSTLKELTGRVIALIGKLESKTLADIPWSPTGATSLKDLPATIAVTPRSCDDTVPWANGEMPAEVKKAGGATWTWSLNTDEPLEIICLARAGAMLYIDDTPVIECPADLPYVPATHRSAPGSRTTIRPGKGDHTVRLELNSTNPEQDVSVILAYPNLHIRPWTPDELPEPASLPPS